MTFSASSGKKFLLVLDDVWNEEYIAWDKLVTMLRCGAKEIKIIITTRSENVATIVHPISIHHLMQLSDEECWFLQSMHLRMENRVKIQI